MLKASYRLHFCRLPLSEQDVQTPNRERCWLALCFMRINSAPSLTRFKCLTTYLIKSRLLHIYASVSYLHLNTWSRWIWIQLYVSHGKRHFYNKVGNFWAVQRACRSSPERMSHSGKVPWPIWLLCIRYVRSHAFLVNMEVFEDKYGNSKRPGIIQFFFCCLLVIST